MSSLVIWFVAMIAVTIPMNNVESSSSSAVDINKILELVQQQQQLGKGLSKQSRIQLRQVSSDSDDTDDTDNDTSDSDDSDNNRNAMLRKESIIDLIDRVANENSNKNRNDRVVYRQEKPNYAQNTFINLNEKFGKSQANNNAPVKILEKLLNKGVNNEDHKPKTYTILPKKRLKPNRLTTTLSMSDLRDYYKNEEATGLEDYSKVYIVLNPQAVQKSKNKDALNELIAKVLSLSSPNSKNERIIKRKPRRYKGFIINEERQSRRSRQSKEMYAPNSMGDDYNSPKRARGNMGTAGGRTAIPYIRHRGDIYERDN